MLILFHENNIVVEITDSISNNIIELKEKTPLKALLILAENYPNSIIVWSHLSNKMTIDYNNIKAHFSMTNVMISKGYTTYLGDYIGYVEDSIFININSRVKYPTWLMHSNCGAIWGGVLLKFKEEVDFEKTFNYNLNSIAKLGMANGLFCYATPGIVAQGEYCGFEEKASDFELFQFIKEHFRARWVILLFFNILFFENKIKILPFFKSMFLKQKKFSNSIYSKANHGILKVDPTVSVLIPTLGRAQYLHDVLKDLANQTLKPEEVIIIEQEDTDIFITALDYLKKEDWPFKITHRLIRQTGACNARNIGLGLATSNYVFLADDDIRFDEETLSDALKFMKSYSHQAVTLSCLRDREIEKHKLPLQWGSFGSGCSIVKRSVLQDMRFDMAFEHGFGEDKDFGMQLRNKGVDIVYLPFVRLKHLKAPIGGFRKKYVHQWDNQKLKPKPSPTVMLFKIKYQTIQQLNSYKITLFFKFYKRQSNKNPYRYYKEFKKRWNISKRYAEKLNSINF